MIGGQILALVAMDRLFNVAVPWLPVSLVLALLAIGAYTGRMLLALPERHAHAMAGRFDLHVWGMWYSFILSALCVGLFVARLSRRLRSRDRELAGLREEALAAERLMALATLAAGIAHELGTPLATIALAAEELEHPVHDHRARSELTRLRNQVARCRDILARMSIDAGALKADTGHRVDVERYLDEVVAEWRQRRPEVQLRFSRHGTQSAPAIVADRVITQAIVNVLANAADAHARRVDIDGAWTADELRLEFRDDGVGIAPELIARLGRVAVTTKRAGDASIDLAARTTPLEQLEWQHIQQTLLACAGNISLAAKRLGLHRRTLQRKLHKRPSGLS